MCPQPAPTNLGWSFFRFHGLRRSASGAFVASGGSSVIRCRVRCRRRWLDGFLAAAARDRVGDRGHRRGTGCDPAGPPRGCACGLSGIHCSVWKSAGAAKSSSAPPTASTSQHYSNPPFQHHRGARVTRHSPVEDRVGRAVVDRDSRRQAEELLTTATSDEAVMKNLLWMLERIDLKRPENPRDRQSVDPRTVRMVRHLAGALRNRELLALLVEDQSVLSRSCRECGSDLTPSRLAKKSPRGRRLEYCRPACRQKSYRRRLNPNPGSKPSSMRVWLAEALQETVERLARAESRSLRDEIGVFQHAATNGQQGCSSGAGVWAG